MNDLDAHLDLTSKFSLFLISNLKMTAIILNEQKYHYTKRAEIPKEDFGNILPILNINIHYRIMVILKFQTFKFQNGRR